MGTRLEGNFLLFRDVINAERHLPVPFEFRSPASYLAQCPGFVTEVHQATTGNAESHFLLKVICHKKARIWTGVREDRSKCCGAIGTFFILMLKRWAL